MMLRHRPSSPLFLPPRLLAHAIALTTTALVLTGCPVPAQQCTEGSCQVCNSDLDCPSGESCSDGLCEAQPGPEVREPEPAPEPDPTPEDDAGAPLVDAGDLDAGPGITPPDAGPDVVPDAGTPDAGPDVVPPTDAGAPDAGPDVVPPVDAGPADAGAADAGSPPLDAGPPPVDAGSGEEIWILSLEAPENIAGDQTFRVKLDHRSLVNEFDIAIDGSDFHLFLEDETEVTRALAPESGWNRVDTEIWFRLPGAENFDVSSVVIIVYIDGSFEPADTFEDVIAAGDNFRGGGLHPSLSLSVNGNDVSTSESEGRFNVDMSVDEADAVVIAGANPLPQDRRFTIRNKMRVDSLAGGGAYNVKTIGIVQWPERPGFAQANNTGENVRQRVIMNQGVPNESSAQVYYKDTEGSTWSWTGTAFENNYIDWGDPPLGEDLIYEIESNGTSFSARITEPGGAVLLETAPVPWADVKDLEAPEGTDNSTGPLWFYWGEVYVTGELGVDGIPVGGPYYTADFSSDWAVLLRPPPDGTTVEFMRLPRD